MPNEEKQLQFLFKKTNAEEAIEKVSRGLETPFPCENIQKNVCDLSSALVSLLKCLRGAV